MENISENDLLRNGELEVLNLTESLHDDVLEYYKNHYMKNENTNKALNITGSENSIAEEEVFFRGILRDNLGFIVRHSQTKEIYAICVNRILTPETDYVMNLEFQTPAQIRDTEFLRGIKASFDIFKEWKIDCVMEIHCISTRKDFVSHGLAKMLAERTLELARKMQNGTLEQMEKDALPEHIREQRPKALFAIATSIYSQKLADLFGFETLTKIPYSELFYEGKSFAEHIDPIHKFVTLIGLKL